MNNFNFETERQRLIENLNYLKSLSVEEYTFRRKWDELRHHIEPERDYIHQADHFMWHPRKHNIAGDSETADAVIAAICEIKPRVIIVGDRKNDEVNFRYWEAYRYFLSSGEHNGVPGRFIRVLILDDFIGRGRVTPPLNIALEMTQLAARLGAEALERAFLNLLADAGQVGREEAFAAQERADRLGVTLGFQINLELFLGAQITPLLVGAVVRSIGDVAAVHVSISLLDRPGQVLAAGALRASFARTCPTTL
jgi:hypothetical protein